MQGCERRNSHHQGAVDLDLVARRRRPRRGIYPNTRPWWWWIRGSDQSFCGWVRLRGKWNVLYIPFLPSRYIARFPPPLMESAVSTRSVHPMGSHMLTYPGTDSLPNNPIVMHPGSCSGADMSVTWWQVVCASDTLFPRL